MSDLYVVPSFGDLKIKSSGKGGLSDGGVLSRTLVLKEAGGNPQVVEIAPPPGEAYSTVLLASVDEFPRSVLGINFDPVNEVVINESFVDEDGVESLLLPFGVPPNDGVSVPIATVTAFFQVGGVVQYPNKLRYAIDTEKTVPDGRVLLKYVLMRYDRAYDQVVG